jgi:hypothetical protein
MQQRHQCPCQCRRGRDRLCTPAPLSLPPSRSPPAAYVPTAQGAPHGASTTTLKALTTTCVARPGHAAAMHGFRLKHRAFAAAVRLTLAWLSRQMFGDVLCQEAVELLVAVRARWRAGAGSACVVWVPCPLPPPVAFCERALPCALCAAVPW